MLSSQIDQEERRRVLENDRRVRDQQGSTFHQFAQADAQIPGRFAAFSATVVGSNAGIASSHPPASSPTKPNCHQSLRSVIA